MLTQQQIILIKKSWRNLSSIDPVVIGDVFYSKLFLDHPQVKAMFQIPKDEQSKKLLNMLNFIVGRLDKWENLDEEVKKLGQRHAQYGVKPHHYKAVGQALLWTLQQGLGMEWVPELKEAWEICLEKLAKTMLHEA